MLEPGPPIAVPPPDAERARRSRAKATMVVGSIVVALVGVLGVSLWLGFTGFKTLDAIEEVAHAFQRACQQTPAGADIPGVTASFDATTRGHEVMIERFRNAPALHITAASSTGDHACVGGEVLPGRSMFVMELVRVNDEWRVNAVANSDKVIAACDDIFSD